MNAKPKMVITCQNVILEQCQECMEWLRSKFEVVAAPCALNETRLSNTLDSARVLVMGGAEIITRPVLEKWQAKASEGKIAIIFAGIQDSTSYTESAIKYADQNGIARFKTGGGIEAVAQSTFQETVFKLGAKRDSRILIVGAGNIGGKVLEKLKGVGYNNLIYSGGRRESDEMSRLGIPYEPNLTRAFSDVDTVSLHLPLIPKVTENLIRYEHLSQIRPNGVFINNARANVVDPRGFLKFLKERKDVSNIWDVFYKEGPELEKLLASDKSTLYKGIFYHFRNDWIDLFQQFKGAYIDWMEIFRQHPKSLFTNHSTAMRPPTFWEYGNSIKGIVIQNRLDTI